MSLRTVAIVGRPNVGKSSLFNRLLKRKLAVVGPQSGITRDRNYAVCEWNGVSFHLVDTGGMVVGSEDAMEQLILDQAAFAINEADLIVFVTDSQVGVHAFDDAIARQLRKVDRSILVAANKADSETSALQSYEFNRLGLGEPLAVSATLGLGIGELLDAIVANLPSSEPEVADDASVIRLAVVGRPNVGKSSLINRLLGQERLIVSPVAGTTRDAVHSYLEHEGRRFLLVDTAGLRRRYKVQESVEYYTTVRTSRAISDCQVAVVVVDATMGITSQDQRILAEVFENRRAAILAVNKWDLIEKDAKTADQFTAAIKALLAQQSFLPIIYLSALTGLRVFRVLEMVVDVFEQFHRRIGTSELNDFLQRVYGLRKPPARQGKHIQLKFLTQGETAPPSFVFFSNQPALIDKAYVHYLENQLRETFGFSGVPIRLKFKDS